MPTKIKPGDELYVGSSWSLDHGETDMCGGIAVVKRLQNWGNGKTIFVEFENLENHAPNLEYVLEHQEEWKKEYGNRIAHDCPDVPGHRCPDPVEFDTSILT